MPPSQQTPDDLEPTTNGEDPSKDVFSTVEDGTVVNSNTVDGETGAQTLKVNAQGVESGVSPSRNSNGSAGFHLDIPKTPSAAALALGALQYLPYPIIVLNSLKTLVLANESMRRLMGVEEDDGDTMSDDGKTWQDDLKGKGLNQLGIDMLQDGRPVWVDWDSFLQAIADDTGEILDAKEEKAAAQHDGGTTPTGHEDEIANKDSAGQKTHSAVRDAVIEVIITKADMPASYFGSHDDPGKAKPVFAKMIITVWEIEEECYYTLSFTATEAATSVIPVRNHSKPIARAVKNHSAAAASSLSYKSASSSTSSGRGSSHGSGQPSAITSPSAASMSASSFPPLGPPAKSNPSAPSALQKIIMMKDALLDNTQMPIVAMWKDESLSVPNAAARRLFHPEVNIDHPKDGFDLITKWDVWDETFSRKLDPSEYPISVLIRTQTPFASRKIGMYDPETEKRIVYDVSGEGIFDPRTGEFLAGFVVCKDVTSFTDTINEIREKDEQRFQLICDSMPQMIWTTTPAGMHDWFSQRW
jgi:PAS domain-containing protein